jgi:hypothetical protein
MYMLALHVASFAFIGWENGFKRQAREELDHQVFQ